MERDLEVFAVGRQGPNFRGNPLGEPVARGPCAERGFFIDNLLVLIHFGGPASRHGSLSSLFQVALYLPS